MNKSRKREKIEETAEFFLKINQSGKHKAFNKKNRQEYPTFRDSITILDNQNEETLEKFIKDNDKDNNYSSPKKLRKSITLNKKLSKCTEPKFKVKTSLTIPQKFINDKELTQFIETINEHIITESEFDFLETEEKIPQIEIDEIEKNKKTYYIQPSFPYNIILDIEKKYEEILQDFKGNGLGNTNYKAKVAANYINCILNRDYLIGEIFKKNKKIDDCLKRELCVFLCILFIEEFDGFCENDIEEYKYCLNLSHINFLFLLMIIINNSDSSKINIYSLK